MRQTISELIASIDPADALEAEHRADALAWIDSGADLVRRVAPATPPKHLVAYYVLLDRARRSILLVDHRKAGLWLPGGGHVDDGEHPLATAVRECREELHLDARPLADAPLFVTVTETVGLTAGHVDVSLWFVLEGDAAVTPWFDERECVDVRWFALDALPLERADPHLGRFAAKLDGMLL